MNNDATSHLRLIPSWQESSMVSRMLAIQDHRESKGPLNLWRYDLKLLVLKSTKQRSLGYANQNKDHETEYLALSYPWASSPYEETVQYNWRIGTGQNPRRSNVRDAILDRVARYMDYIELQHLWIDTECVNQDDQEEKRRILGHMHLIYANSSHPLALLFVPLRTLGELKLLEQLLKGDFVKLARLKRRADGNTDEYVLSKDLTPDNIFGILDLIHRIVSDAWWSRAWCFQEEYVTLSRLNLLLPTFTDLSSRKSNYVMEFIGNDVAISAKVFRKATTQFVFAYVATASRNPQPWILDKGICRHILERVGWYRLMAVHGHSLNLENEGKAMSTQILTDIGRRSYTIPSDLIHISTNCNLYPITLNTRILEELKESLAVCMLTLFFMNGEIFKNGTGDGPSAKDAADLNVFQYLKQITFDEFPARDEAGHLAYLRTHRFVDPHLSESGIQSTGNIWKIDYILDLSPTSISPQRWSQTDSEDSDIDDYVTNFYATVTEKLPKSCKVLAKSITKFFDSDFDPYVRDRYHADVDTQSLAAMDVFDEFIGGKAIGLGRMINHNPHPKMRTAKLGLFAVSNCVSEKNPIYAFTARQGGKTRQRWDDGVLKENKHVSLQVSVDKTSNPANCPAIRVQAPIQSLCFQKDSEQGSVTFAWPRSLLRAQDGSNGLS